MKGCASLLAVLAIGCATPPSPRQPLWGAWGGQHISLVFGANDGSVEYDCAEGSIIGPVLIDHNGSFEAHGTHTPGRGGPERIDYKPKAHDALYRGTVSGDGTMTLTVTVPAIDARIGPYTLRRDAEPVLLRCL